MNNRLPREEIAEKHNFREALEKIAVSAMQANLPQEWQTVTPMLKLESYGSLSNSFGTKGCDADLLLTARSPLGKDEYQEIPDSFKRRLEKALLDVGIGARLLTNTRVPILRVYERPDEAFLATLRGHRDRWENGESLQSSTVVPDIAPLPVVSQAHFDNVPSKTSDWDDEALRIPLPDSPPPTHAKLEPTGDFGISCDINFSNRVALKNTRLLWRYGQCDERVRQMGIFIKSWAKARDINTPYVGSLSSYGYILMVLHYLMNVEYPPVIPNLQAIAHDDTRHPIQIFEDLDTTFLDNPEAIKRVLANTPRNTKPLGALLRGFYQYYTLPTGFNWMHDVISIRTHGGTLRKASKGWTQASQSNNVRLRYLLAIEDPFEIEHNVARTVGHNGIVTIRDEFRRAWYIISNVQKESNPAGIIWVYQKQDQTIGNGIDLIEKAEHGDLLRKDQEAGRRLRQMKKEAEAQHKAALGARTEATSGVVSESGTSYEHELNEFAHGSSSKPTAMLTQDAQQHDHERTTIRSWNDFSKRQVEDDNSSDEVSTSGGKHNADDSRVKVPDPSANPWPDVTIIKSQDLVGQHVIDTDRGKSDLEGSQYDQDRGRHVEPMRSSKVDLGTKSPIIAGQSDPFPIEAESAKDADVTTSMVEARYELEPLAAEHQWSADETGQCKQDSASPTSHHRLSDIVGSYIEWDADTEGGRLLLWRDRKIRTARWTGASAGDKGKLFARFPYNPYMTYGQLLDYNRVLQRLYKNTIHARTADNEDFKRGVNTRERHDGAGTISTMPQSTTQTLTRSSHERSLSQTRVGKNISWPAETGVGQWLLWRDKRIRDGAWRQVSGAFDGLFYKLDRLYPHDPDMTHGELEKQNTEIRDLIGSIGPPRPDMNSEHADQLKRQMHELLNRVIEQRGERTGMYRASNVGAGTEYDQTPVLQDNHARPLSVSSMAPLPVKSESVDHKTGPILWDMSTSAGGWLSWRDKRLASGTWQDQLAPDSVLRRLSDLFPYDTTISVTELASKNDELCRHFAGVHMPGQTGDDNVESLYRAIVSVLRERRAQGISPQSQILLDLLQTHRGSGQGDASPAQPQPQGQSVVPERQRPHEKDARVIQDINAQLSSRTEDDAAFIRQKRLNFYTKNETEGTTHKPSETHAAGCQRAFGNEISVVLWRQDDHVCAPSELQVWSPDTGGEHRPIPLTVRNLANLQKTQSSAQIQSGEGLITETGTKLDVPNSLLPNTWRLSYHDRHEDPRIMPIPGLVDFEFDPKHLELVTIMKRGGNGCAVRGRRFTMKYDLARECYNKP